MVSHARIHGERAARAYNRGLGAKFRLCDLAYHCVHGTAPAYLADSLRSTSEFVARRHLRSADTTTLLVPPTRRVTLGVDRAFPVAAGRVWNSLPAQTRTASLLLSFRRQTMCFSCRIYILYHHFLKSDMQSAPVTLVKRHYNQYFCSSSSSSPSVQGRRKL